jgi:hypothetical protein
MTDKRGKDVFSFVICYPDWRSPWSIIKFLIEMTGFVVGVFFLGWLLTNPHELLMFMILLGLFRFAFWVWGMK